ncbi:hypothetical protein HNY73_003304 [Argiope bruennichi]|uniref:Uncharacterized protein n=1 Tax=Argiope bruennichi TaxID=94029 RepID=A0A8T0G0V2_ARGBR|nr:hypothetical protein HNY73_003304 [Argiope bruennichi]
MAKHRQTTLLPPVAGDAGSGSPSTPKWSLYGLGSLFHAATGSYCTLHISDSLGRRGKGIIVTKHDANKKKVAIIQSYLQKKNKILLDHFSFMLLSSVLVFSIASLNPRQRWGQNILLCFP